MAREEEEWLLRTLSSLLIYQHKFYMNTPDCTPGTFPRFAYVKE